MRLRSRSVTFSTRSSASWVKLYDLGGGLADAHLQVGLAFLGGLERPPLLLQQAQAHQHHHHRRGRLRQLHQQPRDTNFWPHIPLPVLRMARHSSRAMGQNARRRAWYCVRR